MHATTISDVPARLRRTLLSVLASSMACSSALGLPSTQFDATTSANQAADSPIKAESAIQSTDMAGDSKGAANPVGGWQGSAHGNVKDKYPTPAPIAPIATTPLKDDRPANPIPIDVPGWPTLNYPLEFVWVSVGDSFASGEGNPVQPAEVDGDFNRIEHAVWGGAPRFVGTDFEVTEQDLQACHRSDEAGAQKANRILSKEFPEVVFRFANFACSAARVQALMSDGFAGTDRQIRNPQVAQLDLAAFFAADHGAYDALLMSIGGNDAEFAKIIRACLDPASDCSVDEPTFDGKTLDTLLGRLPELYQEIADHIDRSASRSIVPEDVLITAYPNPLTNSKGIACDWHEGHAWSDLLGWATRAETEWAINRVLGGEGIEGTLNGAVFDTWRLGWRVIDGHLPAFQGHGYCAEKNFINTNRDALEQQGDDLFDELPGLGWPVSAGILHPNNSGYEVYAEAIADEVADLVHDKTSAHLVTPGDVRIARVENEGAITVRWNDLSHIEEHYRVVAVVEDAADPNLLGARLVSGQLSPNTQEHELAIAGAIEVRFEVRACAQGHCSLPGTVTGANTPPDTPYNLSAIYAPYPSGLGGQIAVDWYAPQGAPSHYVVEYRNMSALSPIRRALVESDPRFVLKVAAGAEPKDPRKAETNPVVNPSQGPNRYGGAEPGNYRFRVSACNRAGCSPFSAPDIVDASR